jgi:hypothetical protein
MRLCFHDGVPIAVVSGLQNMRSPIGAPPAFRTWRIAARVGYVEVTVRSVPRKADAEGVCGALQNQLAFGTAVA